MGKKGTKGFIRQKQTIEMVRFLGSDFVVQHKYKAKGTMYYTIVSASGNAHSLRFVAVPHETLKRLAEASDNLTFGEMQQKHGG